VMRACVSSISIAVALLCVAPVQAAPGGKEVTHAAELIESLHLLEAKQLLTSLSAAAPDSAPVEFQRGMLAFYQGDYEAALAQVSHAIDLVSPGHAPKSWGGMRDLIASTVMQTREFRHELSPDGRYSVSFAEGIDRVLLPYALDVLSRMDRALTAAVGTPVPGPIRLEIYDSASALAEVSTLTLEQIETSGTVALCKWNRLMITSPRALVRGYPWVDTIAHELTHLYLSYVTQEQAPVWLQEGTAKLLERRWRDPAAPFELDPTSRGLLTRATRDNKLLTFEQLHPSIALLPSQDDATLAFAQVSTFMSNFVTNNGERALRDALLQIAKGTDAKDALARAANTRFADLEQRWRASLPKTMPSAQPRKLTRRFRAGGDETPDESQDVAVSEARRFLRLGDLLWSKKRARAAMLEYEKANHSDADDPIVAARLARAALEAGDPTRSLTALEPLLARYPEHAPTYAVRGAALFELGRTVEARAALLEAIRINPFDPDPHCRLQRIADDPKTASDEQTACALLRAQ
jgi:tetratricopeptide (TPR) repeat protein